MIKTSFGIVRGEVESLRALPLGEAEKKMSYRGQAQVFYDFILIRDKIKYKSFDDFSQSMKRFAIVEEVTNDDQSVSFYCSCEEGSRGKKCVHVLCCAMEVGQIPTPCLVPIANEKGKGKGKGRPLSAPKQRN